MSNSVMQKQLMQKKRVVIGMGKTGFSCARFLRECEEDFIWLDTRQQPASLGDAKLEFPSVDMHCGELSADILCNAVEVIVSPGVSIHEPAITEAMRAGVSVIGDIELFVRATEKPILAITGSNAKSTVTTLLGEMARACGLRAGVGGNLGIPVLDMLAADAGTDCYVLELSSFQLETTHSLRAQAAVILNISDDHLDRHGGLAGYIAAKHRIYDGAAHVVFNRADQMTWPRQSSVASWSFGLDGGGELGVGVASLAGEDWLVVNGERPLLAFAELKLAGKHNLANVAACFAMAAAMDWDLPHCADAARAFTGLPHRCQWVAEKHGVLFYNDSKGTNIGAAIAAIEGLAVGRNIVLIAGGEGKGADFSQLAPVVQQHVKRLILMGRDAGLIGDACNSVQQLLAGSMVDAVNKAADNAEAGDVVLLSPACASFDMFSGYEDRGRQFCAAVDALP